MTSEELRAILRGARTIAVVGLSPRPERPSHQVADYLQRRGYRIVPVNPHHVTLLGEPSYPTLAAAAAEHPIDVVDVFRRPIDIPGHLDDLLAKKPRAVWFQLGIRNDAAAETLAKAGILVVQDKCLKVEYRRHVLK